MSAVAVSRSLCHAAKATRSRARSWLRGDSGVSVVEVLAATVVVGIAVVGVALMFGKGSAWVSSIGADRVAAGLAEERIEQIRACGWAAITTVPADPAAPADPPVCPPVGKQITDLSVKAGNQHTFTRTVCIQYVSRDQDPQQPESVAGKTIPEYSPDCPAGDVTKMIRVTVIVGSNQPEASPVLLQAWMMDLGS